MAVALVARRAVAHLAPPSQVPSHSKKYLTCMPTEEEKTALVGALTQQIVAARRRAHGDDRDSEFELRCTHEAVHGTVHQAALTGEICGARAGWACEGACRSGRAGCPARKPRHAACIVQRGALQASCRSC